MKDKLRFEKILKRDLTRWLHCDDMSYRVTTMILLTKINNALVTVNCDMIQSIEETPDAVITLSNGDKIVVKERMIEIIEKIVEYRRRIRQMVETEYKRQYGTE